MRSNLLFRKGYAMRSASERTNSYDQEVIAKGSEVKMRGLGLNDVFAIDSQTL